MALHLRRDHPGLDARIVVIEPRETPGAGVAYDTRAPELRVNVAAARMTMFAENPTHFDAWLRDRREAEHDPAALMPDGNLFPRRGRVGDYVASMLAQTDVRHLRARAVGATPDGDGFRIRLDDGGDLHADALILAVSNPPPLLPPFLRGLPPALAIRLVADPWQPDAIARIPTNDRVLVVGTGLTGCDVVASLRGQGHRGAIIMLSRRGLLPRPRTPLAVEAVGDFSRAPATTALALLRRVRRLVGDNAARERPWEDVIAAMRDQAMVLWSALPLPEQRRALRHLRVFWDAHRYQSAPQIDAHLSAARADGQLMVIAGSVLRVMEAEPSVFAVTVGLRGTSGTRTLQVDRVVNCTGPAHGSAIATNPLLTDLANQGALQADPCRLGILTAKTGQLVDARGTPWPNAFVVGPLARGTFGELMGLPQISTQPRMVAGVLAASLQAADRRPQ